MKLRRVHVIPVLLTAVLSACADTPTAIRADAAAPALTTYPAPSLTVTNSGGHPLISWSALSGATSYSVSLVVTSTETNRQTAESSSDTDEYALGTTTGTSYLDQNHWYLGDSNCMYSNYPIVYRESWRYKVTATFPGGTSSATAPAPVNQC